MTRVVCTGVGLSTWLADGTERFWRGLLENDGLLAKPSTGLADEGGNVLSSRREELIGRVVAEALEQAAAPFDHARWLVLVVAQADYRKTAPEHVAPIVSHPLVSARADVIVLSHACASVGFAIASARTLLRSRRYDRALVVGACVPTDYDVRGMASARALAPDACRPFDLERKGTIIASGAGALLLERGDDARRRGAIPLAHLAGVACRVGGGSRAGLDRETARRCIELALADAGTPIDYIHAHAAGTRAGDEAELAVLSEVRTSHDLPSLPVSSHKGRLGHLLHCSMFPGVVVAMRALREGIVPGTPGLRRPIPRRGFDLLLSAKRVAGMHSVLVTGFGFGDNNSALVFSDDHGSPTLRIA
jgi:3-oxoacyl-(acyl-carrier-protein) synthase